jgi:alpha-1,3-rhamnosyl/mannosyltransferase
LEALAAGIPTACSQIEPLSSIAAGAALEFDPLDTTAIAGAMLRITADEALRAHLAEAGPRRAAQFSWRQTAEATLAALKKGSDAFFAEPAKNASDPFSLRGD